MPRNGRENVRKNNIQLLLVKFNVLERIYIIKRGLLTLFIIFYMVVVIESSHHQRTDVCLH